MEEERKEYIIWAEPIIKRNGGKLEHPEKAKVEKEYKKCVDRALA